MTSILLAEDSARDAEMVIDALDEYHLANEIVHVRDGTEVMDFLLRRGPFANRPNGAPGVVLLDLKMPKMGGLEVLRLVKGDPALRMIPVVVMTSSGEERDVVASYELGVNAYVVKPVKFHDFVEAMKHLGVFWGIVNQPPPGCTRHIAEKSRTEPADKVDPEENN